MANDISLFSAGMQDRPAHLANVVVDDMTKKLAGGSGGLRISIKGGVWRLLNGGEELQRNEDRAMNVVVVASSPDTARTFYEGTFVEGESKPPTCWSANGVTPEADVEIKQSASCATCPQNVAGSGLNDSRACKYSRKLAVTLENDLSGKVFGISLPAQSIFGKIENKVAPLQAYAKQLAVHQTPIAAVVTELRFDTTSATPKIGFKAVRWLTPEEYAIAKKQGETPEALDAIGTTAYQQDRPVTPPPMDIPGSSPVAAAAAESPVVQAPATVAAIPPVTRQRKAKAAPAETPAPAEVAAVDGTGALSMEAMMAQMAAMTAKMKAMETGGAEPVVKATSVPAAAPAPQGAAAMLSNWETDGDDD